MTVRVIIFDFDGTLVDTLDAIVSITNRLSAEFGYQPASPEDVLQLRRLKSREVIQQSDLSLWKLPFLVRRVRRELNSHIDQLKPILGIREAIADLKRGGYQLGIITSNASQNVRLFLELNGWDDSFDFIHSELNLFGKWRVIEKVLRQKNLQRDAAIYVGDETRDIEAAKRAKIKAIAVSWGFNCAEVLAAHHPDFLIHQPGELISVLNCLQQVDEMVTS